MKPFKIISREILIESPYMPTEKQLVELPNGKLTEWFLNTCSEGVIIVPITTNGEILLQKTYKHGAGEIIIEFCAGMIESGETPLDAAKRELEEETGYKSDRFYKTGTTYSQPTGSTTRFHFFIALDCKPHGTICFDEAEQIENFTVKSIQEAQTLLMDPQTLTASPAITALAYAQYFLSQYQ